MRGMFAELVDLLLPRACARCGAASATLPFCAPCAAAIPRLEPGGCRICQAPLYTTGLRCGACARERGPVRQIAAEAPFAGDVAAWVHRFKYPASGLAGLDPRPGAALGALAGAAARRLTGKLPELVVPVPMHPGRLRERGFHPAGELANAVAAALGTRVARRAVRQVRETASQTGLDRGARRSNVRDAFAAASDLRRFARVALVDDVVTTGATLRECARALRRAGVRDIVAVCAARTL